MTSQPIEQTPNNDPSILDRARAAATAALIGGVGLASLQSAAPENANEAEHLPAPAPITKIESAHQPKTFNEFRSREQHKPAKANPITPQPVAHTTNTESTPLSLPTTPETPVTQPVPQTPSKPVEIKPKASHAATEAEVDGAATSTSQATLEAIASDTSSAEPNNTDSGDSSENYPSDDDGSGGGEMGGAPINKTPAPASHPPISKPETPVAGVDVQANIQKDQALFEDPTYDKNILKGGAVLIHGGKADLWIKDPVVIHNPDNSTVVGYSTTKDGGSLDLAYFSVPEEIDIYSTTPDGSLPIYHSTGDVTFAADPSDASYGQYTDSQGTTFGEYLQQPLMEPGPAYTLTTDENGALVTKRVVVPVDPNGK